MRDLDVDGRILNWMLEEFGVKIWTGLICLRTGFKIASGFCKIQVIK